MIIIVITFCIQYVDYGSRSQEPPHPQMPHSMLSEIGGRPMTPVGGFQSIVRGPIPTLDGQNVPPPQPQAAGAATTAPPSTAAVSTTTSNPIPAAPRTGPFTKVIIRHSKKSENACRNVLTFHNGF